MQSWEILLIVVGVAVVALCVYLITTLKRLNNTLDQINALVKNNTDNVNSIVTNVEAISGDVGSVCLCAKNTAEKISSTVNSYLPSQDEVDSKQAKNAHTVLGGDSLKTVVGIVSAALTGVKVITKISEESKTRKLIKELKKNKLK